VQIAVLASGSGTILGALIEAGLPIRVVLIDRECQAAEVAGAAGIAVERVVRGPVGPGFDRVRYTGEVVAALAPYGVSLIAMAGFGTVLTQAIHDEYPRRILNTHPALLPSFRGWHAVADALEAGVSETGCTVHFATLEVDDGPILAQRAVRVLPTDTEVTLHERIKAVERSLYPEVVAQVLSALADAHTVDSSEKAEVQG
jgi:phosphoribosylglycinamide formyltransferase-1